MKQKTIAAVDVEYGPKKGAWVTVHWNGKPVIHKDGAKVYNRSYYSWKPERITRLITLGRKMQDILLNQSEAK